MSNEITSRCLSPEEAYPIKQSEEGRITRRAFAKFVGVSLVAIAGGYAVKDALFRHAKTDTVKAVAHENELAIGDYKLFQFPLNQPCILIRLTENEYVAFSQSCTHLMCPVHFNKETTQLVCPCHEGYFDAKDGSVISGPPPKALPRFKVTVKDGTILVG